MIERRQRTLLLITASAWQLPVIQAARSIGLKLIGTDRDPNAPGLRFVDVPEVCDCHDYDRLENIAQRHRIDGVISEQTDVGVVSAAYVAERLGLPGIGHDTAISATNKWRMRERCRLAGIPVPQYRKVDSLDDAIGAAEEIGYPVVIKPSDSQASRGVAKIRNRADLLTGYSKTRSRTRQDYVLVEEMMVGTESSAESIVIRNQVRVFGICDKLKCPPPHTYDLRLTYPGDFSEDIHQEIRLMNERVIRAIGISMGITHAEYIVTPTGVRLIEIAARGCGSRVATDLIPAMTGVDLIELRIRQALGEHVSLPLPTKCRSGILDFLQLPPGRVKSLGGLEEAKRILGVVDVQYTVNVGDHIKAPESGDGRHGFVLAVGDSRSEVLNIARQARAAMRIDLEASHAA